MFFSREKKLEGEEDVKKKHTTTLERAVVRCVFNFKKSNQNSLTTSQTIYNLLTLQNYYYFGYSPKYWPKNNFFDIYQSKMNKRNGN